MAEMTTDYDMFELLDCNKHRINQKHVEVLMASIQSCNMLKFKPILVNKDYGILDGQHRFLAAKSLGVPIYYDMDKQAKDDVIIMLNQAQKMWAYEDYLNYYASKGYPEYVKIKEFISKHNIPLTKYLTFFNGRRQSSADEFKNGKIKCLNNAEVLDVWYNFKDFCELVREKHGGGNLPWLNNKSLFRAFKNLHQTDEFIYANLVKRFHQKPFMVFKCVDTSSYLQMLINLYNYRNTNPIKVEEN